MGGRDDIMAKECFILTEFLHFDRYSNVLNDRFGAVYSKNLNAMCPKTEVYTNCTYPYKVKQKPKKNKPKKKDVQQNGSPKQTYSKQNSKNKKKKENELFKDWELAENLLNVWAMELKNPNSLPGDHEGWVNVILNQCGFWKTLYPNIQGQKDAEHLANIACDIDFSQLIANYDAEEKKKKKQAKKKKKKKKKQEEEMYSNSNQSVSTPPPSMPDN